MPELPEVELVAHSLDTQLHGVEVEKVFLKSLSALKTFDPPINSLVGDVVTRWFRRGKFLIGEFESGIYFVVHFSRAGWLKIRNGDVAAVSIRSKSTLAVRLDFKDGHHLDFTEAGKEKRLAIYVVRDLDQIERLASLGVDVLSAEFTLEEFRSRLQVGERIKNALVDQSRFGGIGNAYSDEALHRAKISPYTTSSKLTDVETENLYESLIDVFAEVIERGRGLEVSEIKPDKKENMAVHGRTGQLCPVCGDVVREVSFASKSWQYCATCQTGGKVLADRRMSRLLK